MARFKAPPPSSLESIAVALDKRRSTLANYPDQSKHAWSLVAADSNRNISEILCLGLGNFESSWRAQCQLILLLDLASLLNIPPDRVLLFDPCFTELEWAFLQNRGFRKFDGEDYAQSQPTLFYLPHAPRSLCEKVLLQTRPQWQKHVFLANDLNTYDNIITAEIRAQIPTIFEALGSMKSRPLPDSKECYEAFNDMAFRWA